MANLTYVSGLEWLGTKGAEDAIELPSNIDGRQVMPQGDKDKYSDKQKRKAEHIEEGYEERGVGHTVTLPPGAGANRERKCGSLALTGVAHHRRSRPWPHPSGATDGYPPDVGPSARSRVFSARRAHDGDRFARA